jgi:hypothetical protein
MNKSDLIKEIRKKMGVYTNMKSKDAEDILKDVANTLNIKGKRVNVPQPPSPGVDSPSAKVSFTNYCDADAKRILEYLDTQYKE